MVGPDAARGPQVQASRHTERAPGLADDHFTITNAQRCLKAQLELWFDEPARVYSFSDFAKARANKSGKGKVVVAPPYA